MQYSKYRSVSLYTYTLHLHQIYMKVVCACVVLYVVHGCTVGICRGVHICTYLPALPLTTVTHKIACTQIVSMHLAEADSPLVVPATVGCTTDTAGSGVRTWYPCSFSASRAPDDSRRRMPSSADSGTFDCASVTTKSIVILEREV